MSSDRWICPRCKTDCTETKFHAVGSETNQYGATKIIILCDDCFNDVENFTPAEKTIYFKKALF